jgi:hypothetical protein
MAEVSDIYSSISYGRLKGIRHLTSLFIRSIHCKETFIGVSRCLWHAGDALFRYSATTGAADTNVGHLISCSSQWNEGRFH